MQYTVVMDVASDGIIQSAKGDSVSALGLAASSLTGSDLFDVIAPDDRDYLSHLLFDVQPGQKPERHKATMLSNTGDPVVCNFDVAPVFSQGFLNFTRIGVSVASSGFESFVETPDKIAESLFEEALDDALQSGAAAGMTIYTVENDAAGAQQVYTTLSNQQETQGRIRRLNENSTALVYGKETKIDEVTEKLTKNLDPSVKLEQVNVALDDPNMSVDERRAATESLMAVASATGLTPGAGSFSLSDAQAAVQDSLADGSAIPTPKIRYASALSDKSLKIGMAAAPTLTKRWSKNAGSVNGLLKSLVTACLSSVAKIKPDDISCVVPINAAALLMLGDAEWDQYDLIVRPIDLRELDDDQKAAVLEILTTQYVMVDVDDLVRTPEMLSSLAGAEALAFLRVDAAHLMQAEKDEALAFIGIAMQCADQGIYTMVEGADAATARELLAGTDGVFVLETQQ